MTQRELARRIGIHEVNLSDLFRGQRNIGNLTAQKIAAYLGRADWWSFVGMPGPELRALLMAKGS